MLKLGVSIFFLAAFLSACTPGTYTLDVRVPSVVYIEHREGYPEWPYCTNYYTGAWMHVDDARHVFMSGTHRWCMPYR